MDILRYAGSHGRPFDKGEFRNVTSFLTVRVLPELTGTPMDDAAMGYISALNPTWLRISDGEVTLDAMSGRVTVMMKSDGMDRVIRYVEMECDVLLPEGFHNGRELRCAKEHQ